MPLADMIVPVNVVKSASFSGGFIKYQRHVTTVTAAIKNKNIKGVNFLVILVIYKNVDSETTLRAAAERQACMLDIGSQ